MQDLATRRTGGAGAPGCGRGARSRANALRALAPGDRPREKLARAGAAALGDNELVALLLGAGVAARGVLDVAAHVLDATAGIPGLVRSSFDQLRWVPGVGPARAARLLAAIELGRRALAGGLEARPRLTTPRSLAEYLMPLYGGHAVERFGVVLFDVKHRVIRTAVISVGLLDASLVHPREVFREATGSGAASLALFHNHPSGDPTPSQDDVALTERLARAGDLMGIPVVDHVILGEGRWFSFREAAPAVIVR